MFTKSHSSRLLLCLLPVLLLMGTGCGVPIQHEKIDKLEVTIYDGNRKLSAADGLEPGIDYKITLRALTADGKMINDPKVDDLYIECPNKSVEAKIHWALGKGHFIRVSGDSILLRDKKIRFTIKVKQNPFQGTDVTHPVRWPALSKYVYKGSDGFNGTDGNDGANGADQSTDLQEEPQNGEGGQAGEHGERGAHAPNVKIFATYIRENIDGENVRGILYKISIDGEPARYHYTRGNSISVSTIGGHGGEAGRGGNGGDGGNAVAIDPSSIPEEEHVEGGLGGDGAPGGIGGDGGDGGHVRLYFYGDVKNHFAFKSIGGRGGAGGDGGAAGLGGKGTTNLLNGDDGRLGAAGAYGRDGIAGRIEGIPVSKDEILRQFKSVGILSASIVKN
ncbi:MAG: hypothetical protein CL920_21620 [Deltaproteobacteria bacterium]|nr:hypothetical protein [Deltaproteobacteria bacterium]|tara:strand:- start:1192 stop:2361 length:1170 start_codon:yes stop_codon:yes gene_type:complete